MKVAAMFGDGKAGLVEKPDPVPVRDFALVKVHVSPMCAEYKTFATGGKGEFFGHEAAGEVVEIAQPGQVKVGDRIVVQPSYGCGKCALCLAGEPVHCQNSQNVRELTGANVGMAMFAQYVLKPDWLLTPIPEGMSYEHASMACCGLGPAFGAMQQMEVDALDTVMITGLGPVGLGGVIVASYMGARVIGVVSNSYRADLAKKLGADIVLDYNDENILEAIMDLTGGVGVDKAVDCSGAPNAHRLMVDALRRKGQGCFVGEAGDFTIKVSPDMNRKGLVLRGNWHYNLGAYPALIRIIQESEAKIEQLITHKFPMSEVQKAWELQVTRNCGKVVLDPWA